MAKVTLTHRNAIWESSLVALLQPCLVAIIIVSSIRTWIMWTTKKNTIAIFVAVPQTHRHTCSACERVSSHIVERESALRQTGTVSFHTHAHTRGETSNAIPFGLWRAARRQSVCCSLHRWFIANCFEMSAMARHEIRMARFRYAHKYSYRRLMVGQLAHSIYGTFETYEEWYAERRISSFDDAI